MNTDEIVDDLIARYKDPTQLNGTDYLHIPVDKIRHLLTSEAQKREEATIQKIEVLNGGAKIIIDGKKLLHGVHKRKNPDLYEYTLTPPTEDKELSDKQV